MEDDAPPPLTPPGSQALPGLENATQNEDIYLLRQIHISTRKTAGWAMTIGLIIAFQFLVGLAIGFIWFLQQL